MRNSNACHSEYNPVAIGGVGGSGTRLIAEIVSALGIYIGSDLNIAKDNLWFTLLFKNTDLLRKDDYYFNKLIAIFERRMSPWHDSSRQDFQEVINLSVNGRVQHPAEWLKERVKTFIETPKYKTGNVRWGWKEPNTHVFLDKFDKYFHNMKYIHVVRNGLDMAYSSNQNQLHFWGSKMLEGYTGYTPQQSLKYWCDVHKKVLAIGEKMGDRFLMIKYDDFCSNPVLGVKQIQKFLSVKVGENFIKHTSETVKPVSSVGRYKLHDLSDFCREDIDFVSSLGFDTKII